MTTLGWLHWLIAWISFCGDRDNWMHEPPAGGQWWWWGGGGTHQQLVHAGLAFFQVDSLDGDALLPGRAEGGLHHRRGPAAWNQTPRTTLRHTQ